MKIKIYTAIIVIIHIIAFPLKGDFLPEFSNEFNELDPITAFLTCPQAEQKIKETVELNLDLKASQHNPDDLAKAWDAFNHQSQSEYLSHLGFPTNKK